ncbi:tRNA pseudouridine(55) synthase TruB [Mycoplasma sp. 1890]
MFFKINKKRGESSFFAIKKFAKEHNIKKIGHSGTLDPLAQGLLIVASDDDTKVLPWLINDTKQYFVEASLHCSSKSYDEGEEVIFLKNKKMITKEQLENALKHFKNQTKQIPPVFSAKKINGQRSYDLARKNIDFSLAECNIKIHNLELIDFNYQKQSFIIRTKVSKGTYIRSLIHDIGTFLETDAVVNILKREKIGNIKLNESLDFEQINNINSLFRVKLYTLTHFEVKLIKSKSVFFDRFKNFNGKGLFTFNNQIIGWGQINNGFITFDKVLFNRIFSLPS